MADPRSGRTSIGAAVGALLVLLLAAAAARADAAAPPGVIRWRSGPVRTGPQDAADRAAVLAAAARGPGRHIVVQLGRPPGTVERAALRAAGLELLACLGDNAFFAAVVPRAGLTEWLAGDPLLRGAWPVAPEWKLHPALLAGEIPPWALAGAAKPPGAGGVAGADEAAFVAACVLFHPDIDVDEEAVAVCRRHGARVRSRLRSIGGLVVELPAGRLAALAAEDGVQWIEPPLPRFSEMNDGCRARTGADLVQQAPYGLDGSGVTVLVYDGGTAAAAHPDLAGRVHVRDASGTRTHATHVAGTLGGSGAQSGGVYRGMAPAVVIESYGFQVPGGPQPGFLYADPGDLERDYSEAVNVHGADLATNSIGSNVESNGFDCAWQGDYGVTAALLDAIVRGSLGTPLPVIWAAGNERQGNRCDVEGFGDYYSLAPPACAKNPIVAGALHSNNDSMTGMSSWGPTDDGRIKPDLVAPGCQIGADGGVTSCAPGGGYTTLCGTSSAAPVVAGLAALLLEDFRARWPGRPDPGGAALKALLAHTAADEVAPDDRRGPDYRYGYGSVRVRPAVDLLRSGGPVQAELEQDGRYAADLPVTAGDAVVKVTLAWDDVPAAPNVSPALVNDLDLRVLDAAGAEHLPWTLDPAAPDAPATRDRPDHANNIEQVVIDAPAPGVYRVEVRGFSVPAGPQPFALWATPALLECAAAGTLRLDRPACACQATVGLSVADCDLNADGGAVETTTIVVASTTEPAGEPVVLTETAADSGVFWGAVALDTVDAAGVLHVAPGDAVTAVYLDADDGQGGTNVPVEATAAVDCAAPAIAGVAASVAGPRRATVTFQTDEPARAVVHYGLDCAALTGTATGAAWTLDHAVRLADLAGATTYSFVVAAEDVAGNLATDDAGGACHTLTTPAAVDHFTEEFVGDFDLDGYALLLTPDGSASGYVACADLIAGLPTDPAGGTPVGLPDDGFVAIDLAGAAVRLYGVSYPRCYIGSNGYVTFDAGDATHNESLLAHFNQPRVAALFADLSPQHGSVRWQQLDDRAAVSWLGVPGYGTSSPNTFQIELYFDGRIRLAWLGVAARDAVVGLSAGGGLPVDFAESDLSAATPCGPRRPAALDGASVAPDGAALRITLAATDDGLPDPPARLAYIITALPRAQLLDAGNWHVIRPEELPYTLAGGGREVVYRDFPVVPGRDSFRFQADDGGTPPGGGLSNTATVTITVGQRVPIRTFPLEDDPGWSCEGDWAFGRPLGRGSGGGDPTAGHTGANVYGYNLAGDYANGQPARWLTMPPVDCTGRTGVELRFWRWLGIEASAFDQASVQVSVDGSTWQAVWSHAGPAISETAWSEQVLDIAALADGEPAVQVRWGLGPTDATGTHFGWNIDDVELRARVPLPRCDLNCDGVLDFDDIDGFVLALLGADWYYAALPGCNRQYADADRDGDVDFDDIDALVLALVTGGG